MTLYGTINSSHNKQKPEFRNAQLRPAETKNSNYCIPERKDKVHRAMCNVITDVNSWTGGKKTDVESLDTKLLEKKRQETNHEEHWLTKEAVE